MHLCEPPRRNNSDKHQTSNANRTQRRERHLHLGCGPNGFLALGPRIPIPHPPLAHSTQDLRDFKDLKQLLITPLALSP
ncbi:hypothetical protein E2C01_048439 [Portunus trituberculatus]|uniref:Uncharacterized protein n=1 Tax=Portunus trituberculatus TaxID=210409 RepID=A0A5B7GA84_PORTR|nr:hypothetical protein [Portunus trituberculatus]